MYPFSSRRPMRLTDARMHDILMRDDFSPQILSRLSEGQKSKMRRYIREKMPHCHPRERKLLSGRMALLAPDAENKRDTWEYHHAEVCVAIAGYLHEHGMM